MITTITLMSSQDQRIVDEVQSAIDAREPVRIVGQETWGDVSTLMPEITRVSGDVSAPTPPASVSAPTLRTLSLVEDTGIIAYNPGDLTLTARAGTSLAEIDETLARYGQWLPLDPEGERTGTIGATVATCSYGPLAEFFGTPRDLVLGLTIVTGKGVVLHTGGRVVKNVAGFDLTRLMIGAWGTLGVITQVTIRVMARTTQMYEHSYAHMRRHLPHMYGYRKPVLTHPRLSSLLKHRFDPHGILNPGLFAEVLE